MSGSLTWNSGTISSIGEIDHYSMFLTAGTLYDFYLQEGTLNYGYIELLNSSGVEKRERRGNYMPRIGSEI